jgi:hypothetical protein
VPIVEQWSCGVSVVVVQHAPEALAAQDAAARGGVVIRRSDELVAEALMTALSVIVHEVLSDEFAQVYLAQRYDPRQTLSPRGTNEALRKAFKFGLRAGSRTLLTPAAASIVRQA